MTAARSPPRPGLREPYAQEKGNEEGRDHDPLRGQRIVRVPTQEPTELPVILVHDVPGYHASRRVQNGHGPSVYAASASWTTAVLNSKEFGQYTVGPHKHWAATSICVELSHSKLPQVRSQISIVLLSLAKRQP